MKTYLGILLLGCLCGISAEPGMAWEQDAAGKTVLTGLYTIIGFPSADRPASGVAVLVPGTVIPLTTESGGAGENIRRNAAMRSLSFSMTLEKLWATFRLDPSRQLQESIAAEAAIGKVLSVPVPTDVDVKIAATLESFDESVATYHITFTQGDKSLADSKVPVKRGGRAVVGGMNGDAAPYIFLCIEPAAADADSPGAIRSREEIGLEPPVILRKISPQFPPSAKNEMVSGSVELELTIGVNGEMQDVKVLKSPDQRLTEASISAIRQWRFQPAKRSDGKPVAVIMTITFRFYLK